MKDLPYDPERDFIYLTLVSGAGGPVVAAKKTGATNLREFIEYAKKVGSLNRDRTAWALHELAPTATVAAVLVKADVDLVICHVRY